MQLFTTLSPAVAAQAARSKASSRQENQSGLLFPPPGTFLTQGWKLLSPSLAGGFFYNWATREALTHTQKGAKSPFSVASASKERVWLERPRVLPHLTQSFLMGVRFPALQLEGGGPITPRAAWPASSKVSWSGPQGLGFIKANLGCSGTRREGNSTLNFLCSPGPIKPWSLLQTLNPDIPRLS